MICTQKDDYTSDLWLFHTTWTATLNDGTVVYFDDDRPNLEEKSSWLRLKKHCEQNNLYIVSMFIQFRSNFKSFPDSKDGYFFSKIARGDWGSDKTLNYYNIGYVEDGVLKCEKILVPELILDKKYDRDLKEAEFGIIWKRNTQ